jgi:hypothetical protein
MVNCSLDSSVPVEIIVISFISLACYDPGVTAFLPIKYHTDLLSVTKLNSLVCVSPDLSTVV